MVMDEQPQVATTPAQQSAPPPHCEKVEPVVWLLFGGTVLFSAGTVAVALLATTDGQTFQFLSNLASGFGGALLGLITGRRQTAGKPGA
ncbi:MAG: hypothetical protein K0Q71_2144 [Thermomicrobiales bacterium]|jgi:predicted outer membrane repeat protein|nr:hypothetical protein [Thermomicrobiales bacterium]